MLANLFSEKGRTSGLNLLEIWVLKEDDKFKMGMCV